MLLTKFNPKIAKNIKKGWFTTGIHLAPYDLSGKNICPHASQGCAHSCLNVSGQGYYQRVQLARIRKTKFFLEHRKEFLETLHEEISKHIVKAKKNGYRISFRLNLTSDLAWESIKLNGVSIIDHFPRTKFYDYTKNPKRMLNFVTGNFPRNYHLTFSRSEENHKKCEIVSGCGGNVAVVFRQDIPRTYLGKRVIDGTTHDARFLDPKNCIVGLKALGRAKKDNTGFVVDV